MLRLPRFSFALLAPLGLAVGFACSNETIPAPISDSQFDDPDEPGGGVPTGAADASTLDAEDDAPSPCTTTQECGAGQICFFPTTVGCTGTVGQCIEFLLSPACPERAVCTCANEVLVECAPAGFGSVPNQPPAVCGDPVDPGDGG